ncbi:MAG: formate--tetrahydrofolate ligase, partial [Gammaproteobacteria bacterium]|nr:formate--tetrahydrofolate ligase [Gammaproteobacteria bacterium]
MKAHSLPPNASDGEIAASVPLKPIVPLGKERLGLDPSILTPYGHYKAKLNLDALRPSDSERSG